jgi:hypothetical protein
MSEMEKAFLEQLRKNTLMLQVGCRCSGKTVWASSLLRYLMTEDNQFGEFHLVLPTYESGQTGGTFDWLDELPAKVKSRIVIYCEFSTLIVERIIEASSKDDVHRFLYCDDATSETQLFSNDAVLKAVATKARHYRISILLCFHFLKKQLSTLLRNQCEWIFLHRVTDGTLCEHIHEEAMSMFVSKTDFMLTLRNEMVKDFPSIVLWRDRGKLSCDGMDWTIIKRHRNKILKKSNNTSNTTATDASSKPKQTRVVQIDECHTGSEPGGSDEQFPVPKDTSNKGSLSSPFAKLTRRPRTNRRTKRI